MTYHDRRRWIEIAVFPQRVAIAVAIALRRMPPPPTWGLVRA